jgi:hypothetical protein
MGSRIKTTIELSDVLFNSAKSFAHSSQTTLRALIEEGLRRVLADAQMANKPTVKLQDASVKGGAMLMTDSRQWQALEEEHVSARTAKPSA